MVTTPKHTPILNRCFEHLEDITGLVRTVFRPRAITNNAIGLVLLVALVNRGWGNTVSNNNQTDNRLTHVSLEELGEIEVTTASKEPVKVNRTPAAIYVITQEDIRQSGASSIPEVLRLAPGVEVARIDSDSWSLGVRGFGSALSRSVLVLIDGRTVYTPLFAGVWWQVQDTLLEDVERIEVIRGPGGTIWGANAVNAVINIITKDAKATHGSLVSLGGGNIDQGFANVRYGAGEKGFDYRIYAKMFTRGPQFHHEGRRFDDWRMGQTGFRADWDFDRRDTLTLQGDLYNGDAGQSVGIATYSPPFTTVVEQNAELSGGNLVAQWKRVLGLKSDVSLQAYYDRTNRGQSNFAESRDTFDLDFIHHRTLPHQQDFLWGLGARFSSGRSKVVVPTVVFTPGAYTDKLYSAFVQDEIPIVENQLFLTVGSKVLHNSYSGFEVQPSARLLWAPTPRQSIWTAVTRAVRTPSRVEEDLQLTGLFTPNPLTFYRITGGRKFSSEHLVGYELGYRKLVTPQLYIDIATFYNNYDNLLSIEAGPPFAEHSPSPPHNVIPFLFRNGIMGNTGGVEITPDWTPTHWLRLKGSYSYLHMDFGKTVASRDTSTANITEGSSPHHQVVAQSSFKLPAKLSFDQTFRYVSSLPAQLVRAYATADVGVRWQTTRSLELFVAGQNLFQPHHAEFGGDPGPLVGISRAIYVKLNWRSAER